MRMPCMKCTMAIISYLHSHLKTEMLIWFDPINLKQDLYRFWLVKMQLKKLILINYTGFDLVKILKWEQSICCGLFF